MTLAFSIPWTDWQFWAVTLVALGALWFLTRGLWPAPFGTRRRPGQAPTRRATLTVGGKPVGRSGGA